MFRDKPFNAALLISILWHIFCMFFVTIVVLPTSFPLAKVSNISFLGPILEKTAFEIMIERNVPSKHTLYGRPTRFNNMPLKRGRKEEMNIKFKDFLSTERRRDTRVSSKDLFGDSKVAPPFQHVSSKVSEEEPWQKNLFIKGPLVKRDILFKPEMPVISERIGQRQKSFIVKLKANVLPGGNVSEVTLLASSGYPDIDLKAINYMKGFRFSPLGPAAKDKSEWGNIRINLKSR